MAWFKDKGLKNLKILYFLCFWGFIRTMQEKENFLDSFMFSRKKIFRENENERFFFASPLGSFFFFTKVMNL